MVINLNVSRFIFRYEVRFQKALECGGAYIKLLADLPGLSLVWFQCHCSMFVLFSIAMFLKYAVIRNG